MYGFEQAKKEYSLREYARMANDFKEEYFSLTLEVGAGTDWREGRGTDIQFFVVRSDGSYCI